MFFMILISSQRFLEIIIKQSNPPLIMGRRIKKIYDNLRLNGVFPQILLEENIENKSYSYYDITTIPIGEREKEILTDQINLSYNICH
jgi:hypothetical protein